MSMEDKISHASFSNFFLHPTECAKSKPGKVVCTVLSVLVGIVTIGTIHGICKLREIHKAHADQSPTTAKTGDVFDKIVTPDKPTSSSVVQDIFTTLAAEKGRPITNSRQLVKIEKTSEEIPPQKEQVPPNTAPPFHTVKDLQTANVGDYHLSSIRGGKHQLMQILTDSRPLKKIIRESSSAKGTYRYVLAYGKDNKRALIESSMTFTKPQLSAMLRMKKKAPAGFHELETVTKLIRQSGLIIFKCDLPGQEGFYCVNKEGILQRIEKDKIGSLVQLIKIFIPKVSDTVIQDALGITPENF